MLTPKTLLAETAKFFALNPDRWIRNSLKRRNAKGEECFCTVGYMADRLRKEGQAYGGSDYDIVGRFLKPAGIDDSSLVADNDSSSSAQSVVQKLATRAARVNA